ncbi:uncharacterized protein LOC124450383 [Xenia sp. Carnegie-2017]|uniref:uncharacterized protein LOC124450383 n=1 Tax=Xenia sp. Carnegie-2017 TaxID=2897299 RepID=UPI001F04F567|nr:uncharacterized protein LOC124450383 [Xenia sp. Carnegie-2017]
MSSFILRILSSTVGVLCNKVQDKTAEKLKDGDVTDVKLREFVVRELNDIKTKIDGLSRKDLLSSYDFFNEGIYLLLDCIENSSQLKKEEQEKLRNLTLGSQNDASLTSSSQSSERCNDFDQEHKLDEAFKTLSIECPFKLKTAVIRFRDASKQATLAFNNESLSIEDRIFAGKIRIVSTIWECMERPQMAITLCLPFLEKLHSLPAIREIFNVYINGGVKSLLKRHDRMENVRSMMFINRMLYQIIKEFGKTYPMALDWPTIQLKNRQFNPIWHWRNVSERFSWRREVQGPNELEVQLKLKKNQFISTENFSLSVHVNSGNDLVSCYNKSIGIIRKDAHDEVVYEFPESDYILATFIDKNDDLYVLVHRISSSENDCLYLVVFDPHFGVKREISLDFIVDDSWYVGLFVSAENLVVYQQSNNIVLACDMQGKLIKQFKVKEKEDLCPRVSVTKEKEIVLGDKFSIYIYSIEGCLKSTINLNIHFQDFFYHFGLKKFLIIENCYDLEHYRIYSCDRSGKLETLTERLYVFNVRFLQSSQFPVIFCESIRNSPYLMPCY